MCGARPFQRSARTLVRLYLADTERDLGLPVNLGLPHPTSTLTVRLEGGAGGIEATL